VFFRAEIRVDVQPTELIGIVRASRMSYRRLVLVSGVGLLCALAARRARALDPSELSVGGSTGAHDAHIACGPDVRVRHASGGVQYERLFEKEPGSGRGATMDVRAAVGSMTITGVAASNDSDTAEARRLADNELNKTHLLLTTQAVLGWDWKVFALRGGVGYFGFADVGGQNDRFRTRYYPLPALDMRFGQRTTGFRGQVGVGAPPIPGLIRWYAFYGLVGYRFKEGGEVGFGHVFVPYATLDRHGGFIFHGMFPVTENIHVGAFGMAEADEYSKFNSFNWTAGGALRVMLDAQD